MEKMNCFELLEENVKSLQDGLYANGQYQYEAYDNVLNLIQRVKLIYRLRTGNAISKDGEIYKIYDIIDDDAFGVKKDDYEPSIFITFQEIIEDNWHLFPLRGEKYKCKKTYTDYFGNTLYKKGCVYHVIYDGQIKGDDGDLHSWYDSPTEVYFDLM